jgi:hypothetical protein
VPTFRREHSNPPSGSLGPVLCQNLLILQVQLEGLCVSEKVLVVVRAEYTRNQSLKSNSGNS